MPLTRLPRVLPPSFLCLSAIMGVFATGCGSGGTLIVPQPAFSPAPGNYNSPVSVALTDALSDATIHYTTDGTLPTTSSTRYTGPIPIASTTTLEVLATVRGYRNSPVVAATYTIAPERSAAAPTFTPPAGTYSTPQPVAIQDSTPNAQIFYTTDGTTPTTASTLYAAPIQVASSEILKAFVTAPDFAPSPIATASYTIAPPPAAAPTFNPPAGTYSSAQTIQIADSTPNATIFYTTDGTSPTTASTPYTSPFPLSSTATVEAIATAPNFTQSPAATATYSIAVTPPAAAPTFNPPAGNYPSAQTIQIADSTPNATIFYTTDGTTPTTASTPYTSPFPLSSTATVEAIATAPNFTQSPVATAIYTIGPQSSGKGMWTWMGGTDAVNPPPVYGTLGTASSTNSPGSTFPTPFPNAGGTVDLFGGEIDDSTTNTEEYMNTLWQFNPVSASFTWIGGSQSPNPPASFGTQGIASPANQPPPRAGGSTWTDKNGKLWLFGGSTQNPSLALLGDLWEYDPASSQWTWVGGSQDLAPAAVYGTLGVPADSNYPGQRDVPACKDNHDNVYLFGGFQQQAGYGQDGFLNDLWRYSIASNQWTWLAGSTQFNQPGVYGTRGVAATGNTPGARTGYNCWSDPSGNIWIFGGIGYDSSTNPFGYMELNDLWEFNTGTGLWTWIGGSSTRDSLGNFGALGVPSPTNQPPSRNDAAAWTDAQGDLWLFGGAVLNALYGSPIIGNDLWRFNIATSQWTWMNGSATVGQYGTYGSLGVPAAGNVPGARDGNTTWVDDQGNLWLYGGFGNSDTTSGYLADLWRYQP